MLEFKPDYEAAFERIEAWWQRELCDRLPIMITAPRVPEQTAPVPESGSVAEQWWREDFVLDRAEALISNSLYKGEALPVFAPDLGRDVFAAFFGASLIFGTDEVFVESPYEGLDAIPPFGLDTSNSYLQWLEKCMHAAINRARGRFLVGLPLIRGGLDCLAALLTKARMALAAEEEFARVEALMSDLGQVWNETYIRLARPLLDEYGATQAAPCRHAGRCGLFMPEAAEVLPPASAAPLLRLDLEPKTARLDRSILHLADPGMAHRRVLLDLEDLTGFYLDLREASEFPFAMLREIQAAGKCLLLEIHAAQFRSLMAGLEVKGVMPRIQAEDEAEADALLREAEKIVS
ncbi:hypothetical protein ACFL4W_00990 [Planctomycetota bacterium]